MKEPINTGTVPNGGFWTVVLGNVEVKQPHISAFKQRAFAVMEAAGMDTSEGWAMRLFDEVCRQHPDMPCREIGEQEVVTGWDDVRRFFNTLGDLLGSSKPLVSEEEQERRIAICLKCPKNASLGNCSMCGWFGRKLSELAGGRKIKDEPLVHRRGCASCGCELGTKTAYPIDVLKMVDKRLPLKSEYDVSCWMREDA